MKLNADSSVNIYIGPKAPKGFESNWLPTQGKPPFPVIRIYGGDNAFWDKSFKMPAGELTGSSGIKLHYFKIALS